jgi:putative Mg2+ transporter-C (MgtC) family protein
MSLSWPEIVEALRLDLFGSLLLATVLGGAIGLERELRGKAAGLRTNILICTGATLFSELSILMAGPTGDPTRIAAQIVTGVGFLGAGTILRSRGGISGLTSAATIWLVAAIGVAVGAGAWLEAAGAALLVVLTLASLRWVEYFAQAHGGVSRLLVEVEPDPERVTDVEQIVRAAGARIAEIETERRDDRLVIMMAVGGTRRQKDRAKLALLRDSVAFRVAADE